MENAKEFFSNVGGKLKEKAGSLGSVAGSIGSMFSRLNTKWRESSTVDEIPETDPASKR